MSTNKTFLALAFATAISADAFPQLTNDGNTPGGEYYIHGIFNPVIADVHKIDLRPTPYDTILPVAPISYQMLTVKGEVPARVDSIEAAKLNIQLAQQKLYKGFVKAGFGLYTTPLFEVYYDQTRNRKNAYGLHFKHLSSNGGIKDVGPSDYSFNNVDAFYSAYLKHHEVTGKVIYDRRRISYYGYDPSIPTEVPIPLNSDHDELRQIYNDIGFAARLKSLYKDSTKVAHDVGLEVHHYWNLASTTETNVTLDAKLKMDQGAETYGGNILIDNNAYRAHASTSIADILTNGTMIGLEPFVSTGGDKYNVRVGAGMFLDAQGKSTFHFFPQAYADYHLFEEILVPYVGVDGRRVRNSFRSLTRENPFLDSSPNLTNSSLMYDIYGGLRGSFSSDVGFDVRVSKSRMKDRPLYVKAAPYSVIDVFDPVHLNPRFDVIYDEVDQLDLSGEINYSHGERVNVSGRIDVLTYSQEHEAEAWNLPPYRLTLAANYNFQDKLRVKVEAMFIGARKAAVWIPDTIPWSEQAPQKQSVDLKGYVDLHLGLEYRYTKRLSVFFDVSNLSASKYERWYRYPVQRTLFLGGATFAF